MQNLRSERPPRGFAISRKAWKREGPIRLPCKHPRLSGMDPPLPHTLRPGALGRLRNGIRAFPCDKAQRPALLRERRTGHRQIRRRTAIPPAASAVYVRIPSTMEHHRESPGLLVHDQKHAGRSEYAEHLGKGGGYIRPEVDRLESGDEIEGRIGIGQPGNIPLPHFAAPGGDGSGVLPEAGGDALSGKIDPADRPLRAEFQKLAPDSPRRRILYRAPGVGLRRHMRPTPLRQRSVPPVHSPQHDPSG